MKTGFFEGLWFFGTIFLIIFLMGVCFYKVANNCKPEPEIPVYHIPTELEV